MTNFVCEYLAGRNGMIFLDKVKAFECDFKINGQDVHQLNSKREAQRQLRQSVDRLKQGNGSKSIGDVTSIPRQQFLLLSLQ